MLVHEFSRHHRKILYPVSARCQLSPHNGGETAESAHHMSPDQMAWGKSLRSIEAVADLTAWGGVLPQAQCVGLQCGSHFYFDISRKA